MTEAMVRNMGSLPHNSRRAERPRDRLKALLWQHYRTPKELARALRCTPKAAENMLNGHWPGDLHMAAIIRQLGLALWDAVFAPEIEPVLAALSTEERRLEEQIAAVRARRLQIKGGEEGSSERVAEPGAGLGAVPKRRAASDRRH